MKKTLLALAILVTLAVVWLSGYRTGQVDERAFTLGCEPGLISGPCVRDAQNAEYVRVVGAVADAYGYDPSEVEQDAGLVDASGNIKR